MAYVVFPCKDCKDRHKNCHSTCEKYISLKSENDRIAKKVQKDNKLSYSVIHSNPKSEKSRQKIQKIKSYRTWK